MKFVLLGLNRARFLHAGFGFFLHGSIEIPTFLTCVPCRITTLDLDHQGKASEKRGSLDH